MKIARSFSRKQIAACLFVGLAIGGLAGCGSSPEAKSAKRMARGKELLEKKDPARAILEFKAAVQATPKNPEAHYQLALAYIAAGDLRKGIADLRRTLELDPKHNAAQLRMAQLLTAANEPELLKDAQQRLQALLAGNSGNSEALQTLALAELKLGETTDAMQHLEEAMAAAPQDLAVAATFAAAKFQQKDLKGAEETLKKAAESSPNSVEAAVILGRFYVVVKKYAEAEQQFQRALSIDPKHGGALVSLAVLQYQTGRKQDAEQNFKRLSESPDKQANVLYGSYLFQEGRRDEAVREFERLWKQDPADRSARGRLVAAYRVMNRTSEAHKILVDALKKNARDTDALLQNAELLISDGKYQEAESSLNQVLHLRPDSPEVYYILARFHESRGALGRQREELNEALRLNPSLLAARLDLARSLIAGNAAKAALGILDGASDAQKHQTPVIEQQNWALIATARLAEARQGVDRGLAVSRTPDLLIQDGLLKIDARQYGEARRSLHEALTKAPEDVRALRVLTETYLAEKQPRAAVEDVRAHAIKYPKSAPVQYFLGNLLLETGAQAQARQALAAAKAANPGYAPADLALARIDLAQANWGDGRRRLDSILATDKENWLARQWLGMVEMSAGNMPAAIANFRKVVESQPNNALALNNLAYLLVEQGNTTEEPLKYAQKAKELNPVNPEFDDTLGWVLYRRGLYDVAVRHLELAVSKQATALRQYHLAMAYCKAGKVDRSRVALNTALRMNPNLPEAKAAQQMLAVAAQSQSSRNQ